MNVLDIIKMDIKSYRFVTCCMEPEDNILFCNYHENINVNLEIARELVNNRLEFTKNKKHYLISYFPSIQDIHYDAILYLKSPEVGLKNLLGAAYITNDNISTEIAKILMASNRKLPTKNFKTEHEATTWINQLKEYHKITQQ